MTVRRFGLAILTFIGPVGAPAPAWAVPSYSRQTGEPCTSCHVGGFGPQLTPHGRAFKLSGYSDGHATVPLSAFALAGFTHTSKDQTEPVSEHDGRNNNVALQEVVGFVAGKIAPHFGTFIGVAYSEIEGKAALDDFDMRYALPLKAGGKDLIWGFDINNNPGVQDAFNTFAWGFPAQSSELVPETIAGPLLDDALGGQVAGLSTYLWYDESIYAEIGGYRSLSHGVLNTIGVEDEAGKISGVAPYVRLAYQKDFGRQVAAIGLIGMQAKLHPEREPGPTNKFTDWGIDATYQHLGNRKNIITAQLAYLHEHQGLDFDFAQGATARRNHSLNSLKANVGWSHLNNYGLTLDVFSSWGTRDTDLFAPEVDSGSRTGKPNTSGYVLQADWTPFGKEDSWGAPYANLRLGLQYTGYFKFNGASHDYDGFGRDASDNNTIFAYAAVAF